jgi:hypothetical protein
VNDQHRSTNANIFAIPLVDDMFNAGGDTEQVFVDLKHFASAVLKIIVFTDIKRTNLLWRL